MPDTGFDLSNASNRQLLCLHGDVLAALKQRAVVRTRNAPSADYAEWLVADRLHLTLLGNSHEGYDATDAYNTRYQIKSRWLNTPKALRQLSPIRNLASRLFDYLIVVLFSSDFGVQEAYQMPIEVIGDYARYSKHINGHILVMKGAILSDPRVKAIARLLLTDCGVKGGTSLCLAM